MYKRKTADEWQILGKYGYGWEVVTTESSLVDAKRTIKEYRTNERQYGFKLKKIRVKI